MKINTAKNHEIVAEDILRHIRSGEWSPGQRLPSVVELAESYGVGRSSIREAVSALKAMGWLDVRHGGGTFVRAKLPDPSKSNADALFQNADSLIELLEVRKTLEVGAISLAAERRSQTDLDRLFSLLTVMEQSLSRNETSESEKADVDFHMAIAIASGNSLLIQMMESLSDRFSDTIRQTRELWFYREKATAMRLLKEHRMIYEAIERQDVPLAESLVNSHLTKIIEALRNVLT